MSYISDLTKSQQEFVYSLIASTNFELDEKIELMEGIIPEIREKCKEYVTLVETYIKKIPYDKELEVRILLTDNETDYYVRTQKFHKLALDQNVLKEGLLLAKQLDNLKRQQNPPFAHHFLTPSPPNLRNQRTPSPTLPLRPNISPERNRSAIDCSIAIPQASSRPLSNYFVPPEPPAWVGPIPTPPPPPVKQVSSQEGWMPSPSSSQVSSNKLRISPSSSIRSNSNKSTISSSSSLRKESLFTEVPDVTSIPFLTDIPDKKRRREIETLILDLATDLTNFEKKKKLETILSGDKEIKSCKKFLSELKKEAQLLDLLPKVSRPGVAAILREKSMTLAEKQNSLRFMLEDKAARQKCKEYLQEKLPVVNEKNTPADEEIDQGHVKFFENAPKEMNILILGQTGVGKSTFINGLANYLKFRSMREAKESKKVEILITSYFTTVDENYNTKKIVCKAKNDRGNENTDDGTSSTLSTMSYAFQWGPSGHEKLIRLIDTPGVGDVSGFEKDKANFRNIYDNLADYKELHAVCILLKPNESKLNTTFTYCLGELLSNLNISAQKNILFCFTNTRSTGYKPGETVAVLAKYVEDIVKRQDIQIPLNRSTFFCFDNESFRFLCQWKEGVKFTNDQIKDFSHSWEKSVGETFKFFTRVSQLKPHTMSDTLAVNNIRTVFNLLTKPLADLKKDQKIQNQVIAEKEKEIANLEEDILELNNNTSRNQKITTRQDTGRIDTVCSAGCCAFPDKYNVQEMSYKLCHKNCECVKAKLSTCNEPKLQKCSCIDDGSLNCDVCGCCWLTHMHINYELVTTTGQVTDDYIQNRLTGLQNELATKQQELQNFKTKKDGQNNTYQEIKTHTEDFAAYLLKNAILPYNSHKKEYFEKLIKEEKQKISEGKSDKELTLLENASSEHEQQAVIIDGCKTRNPPSYDDLEQTINQLKSQSNGWNTQNDLAKMKLLTVRKKQMMRSTVVNLNEGWVGGLF